MSSISSTMPSEVVSKISLFDALENSPKVSIIDLSLGINLGIDLIMKSTSVN